MTPTTPDAQQIAEQLAWSVDFSINDEHRQVYETVEGPQQYASWAHFPVQSKGPESQELYLQQRVAQRSYRSMWSGR